MAAKSGRDSFDTKATSNTVRDYSGVVIQHLIQMQVPSPELPTKLGKTRTTRCYECHGHFGLIRRKFAMKQFCSRRCVDAYKTNTKQTIHRMKVWADFLAGKPGER